jgi:hypothetical protein
MHSLCNRVLLVLVLVHVLSKLQQCVHPVCAYTYTVLYRRRRAAAAEVFSCSSFDNMCIHNL